MMAGADALGHSTLTDNVSYFQVHYRWAACLLHNAWPVDSFRLCSLIHKDRPLDVSIFAPSKRAYFILQPCKSSKVAPSKRSLCLNTALPLHPIQSVPCVKRDKVIHPLIHHLLQVNGTYASRLLLHLVHTLLGQVEVGL